MNCYDLTVESMGAVAVLSWGTEAGREWVQSHLSPESWQYVGGQSAIAIEPRYSAEIVDAARADGLTVAAGDLEMPPEAWYSAAVARVEGDPQLEEYSPAILYDWHEGAAHWQWVATAPVAEIVAWAQSVDVSEEAAPWEGLTLRHARYREDTDR